MSGKSAFLSTKIQMKNNNKDFKKKKEHYLSILKT